MHLLKRNNTYYYKIKIPKDLQNLISMKEVRFSLRTYVKRDALLLSSTLTNKYYTLFTQLRSGIFTKQEVTHLISSNIYFERLYQKEGQQNLNKSSIPLIVNTLNKLFQKYSNDNVLANIWTKKILKSYSIIIRKNKKRTLIT